MSGAAYFPGGLGEFCKELKVEVDEIIKKYDGVIHLESLAIGKPDYYGKQNNSARFHTLEQARKADEDLKNIWGKHFNHFIVDSRISFDQRIENIKQIINKMTNL